MRWRMLPSFKSLVCPVFATLLTTEVSLFRVDEFVKFDKTLAVHTKWLDGWIKSLITTCRIQWIQDNFFNGKTQIMTSNMKNVPLSKSLGVTEALGLFTLIETAFGSICVSVVQSTVHEKWRKDNNCFTCNSFRVNRSLFRNSDESPLALSESECEFLLDICCLSTWTSY